MPRHPPSPSPSLLFLGLFRIRLQVGGRINLPSEWREELAERRTLLVAKALNMRCILLMPDEAFHNLDAEEARRLGLIIHSRVIDTRGRVRLPRDLIEAAGLKADITALGMLNGMELWNPEIFDEERHSKEDGHAAGAIPGF